MNFNSNHQLSDVQLQKSAPAIFTAEPAGHVSDKYIFVSTIDILNGLRDNGWVPVQAVQSHSRVESGHLYAKHMLRLRHEDYLDSGLVNVGDVIPEVILYNSHNAGSSFQLSAGLHRKVCDNGLVIPDPAGGAHVKVDHRGEIIERVIEGSFEVIREAPKHVEDVKRMQAIEISRPETLLLAQAASDLRWEHGKAPVTPESLIVPRRWGDKEQDLWTQFNVIQENMIKGGVRGRSASGRRMSTRQVKAPDQNIGLNRALWTLAEGFAELKGEAA